MESISIQEYVLFYDGCIVCLYDCIGYQPTRYEPWACCWLGLALTCFVLFLFHSYHYHCNDSVAAAILGGVDNIWIKPGSKVLYIGAAAGTSVSHVSDIVGPKGAVYAVEFSHRPGRDLINVAKSRTNVIPIVEDARHPLKYRMLVGMVDVVFADVAQPDQARIVALNSHYFLKNGGHAVIAVKASCIDSTAAPEAVFRREVSKLQSENFKPLEQLTLEPYERDHAVVIAEYRPSKKTKKKDDQ